VNTVVKRFGAAHPLGRVGTVEEIAELAAFLLSNRSTFCTGGDYLVIMRGVPHRRIPADISRRSNAHSPGSRAPRTSE
jgi:hypothetical protein